MAKQEDMGHIWAGLSARQIDAVSYKLLNPKATYEDMALATGIPASTLGNWRLSKVCEKIKQNKLNATLEYAERLSIKSMRVLEKQLDSDDERVAQSAAKEILDRFMGRTIQRQEIAGKEKLTIEITRK